MPNASADKAIYEYVMEAHARSGLTYGAIAVGSKVPKRTVEKVLRKEFKNPGVHTVQRLHDFFKQHEHQQ